MFRPMNIIHRSRLPHRAAESDYLRYKVLIFYRTEYIPYLALYHYHLGNSPLPIPRGKNKQTTVGGSPTSGFPGRYKYVGKLMVYNSQRKQFQLPDSRCSLSTCTYVITMQVSFKAPNLPRSRPSSPYLLGGATSHDTLFLLLTHHHHHHSNSDFFFFFFFFYKVLGIHTCTYRATQSCSKLTSPLPCTLHSFFFF